jgi:pyridoxamine 5'-phosphate oxidase
MSSLRDEIKKLREDFMKHTLSEVNAKKDPFEQFELWLGEAVAAQAPEVQAMTLTTVSPDGKPASRIVYLREFENGHYWFYGNYNSKKALHMASNPNVSLNFFWPSLERQIRIEGTVVKCDNIHNDHYFYNRPRESQIGAWASQQSSPLKTREDLEARVAHFEKQFKDKEVPRPDFWGGWIVTANYYEFWQGRKSRLHDRITYTPKEKDWLIQRLAP